MQQLPSRTALLAAVVASLGIAQTAHPAEPAGDSEESPDGKGGDRLASDLEQFKEPDADKEARKIRHAEEAKRFVKKGKRAYKAARWDDAISAFRLAHDLDPRPSYLFNIARCLAKKGELAQAVEEMALYVDDEPDESERADGEDELRILRKRLASTYTLFSVSTIPSGAAVVLREKKRQVADTAPFERWLPQGAWTLTASMPDYKTHTETLVARPGESLSLQLELEPIPEDVPPPPSAGVVVRPPAPPPPAVSKVPWFVAGTGVALLIGGGLAGLVALAAAGDRDDLASREVFLDEIDEAEDRAKTRAVVANILFGLGALTLVSSAGLYVVMTPTAAGAGGRF